MATTIHYWLTMNSSTWNYETFQVFVRWATSENRGQGRPLFYLINGWDKWMCLRDLPTKEQVNIPEFCFHCVCLRIFVCCIFHAVYISPFQCMHSENVRFSSVWVSPLMKIETLAKMNGNKSCLHRDHLQLI